MFLINKNLIFVLTVLAVGFVSITPARAFFPSDDEISSSIHSSYARFDSYEVEITFPEYPTQSLKIYNNKNKWRQDWTVSGESNSTVSSAVGYLFDIDQVCPYGAVFPIPLTSIWMPRDPIQDWVELGVNNVTKSYGFSDNIPALIIGAETGDDNSTQVWLDNENFTLLKFIRSTSDGKVEFKFDSYERFGGFNLPKTCTISFPGLESIDVEFKWISVNKNLDSSLFNEKNVRNLPCNLPHSDPFKSLSKYLLPEK